VGICAMLFNTAVFVNFKLFVFSISHIYISYNVNELTIFLPGFLTSFVSDIFLFQWK